MKVICKFLVLISSLIIFNHTLNTDNCEAQWAQSKGVYGGYIFVLAARVNESLKPGTYETTFDGGNLSSGIYFYKLIAGDYSETKHLILLK
jgi:hypothetical protein